MGADNAVELGGRPVAAVVFDMDGVVTDTASAHAASWKRMFDEYLGGRSEAEGEPFRPFEDEDYLRYVDGKLRYDGVRDFLTSRAIALPEGDPSDPPDRESVCGLGNRKNLAFLAHLRDEGAEPYASTIELLHRLRAAGVRTAVISSSRNMDDVLESAGVADLFDARVDGADADDLDLPGKPNPAIFLEAARRLGVEPIRAAVVEDAIAGVEGGRRGGFGLVVGIDRGNNADGLRMAGADVVVEDLGELSVGAAAGARTAEWPSIRDLPSALERTDEIAHLIGDREPVVFLDYDGTLTPIVARPEDALLAPETRRTVEALAGRCTVAVVSGRDLPDVRHMVGVDGIWYAGSHGFDIAGPGGRHDQRGREFLPELDEAERELSSLLEALPGARVERKTFAVAVHFRQVDDARLREVEAAVERVAVAHPRLRRTGGKKVFELRPNIPWDKGKALLWLLELLGLDRADVVPIYVGDDETDEDAFRAIGDRGLGVVVRGEADRRATSAGYALDDPAEVRLFLEDLRSGGGSP